MPVELERTLEGGHLTVPLQRCKTREIMYKFPSYNVNSCQWSQETIDFIQNIFTPAKRTD